LEQSLRCNPQTPSQVDKDQLTMKDKRDKEERLEKQKNKKDSKALSSKAKGKEKEEKDSAKKIVKKENHFATKGDIKRAPFLNNPSTFSYHGKHPLALSYLLSLRFVPYFSILVAPLIELVRNHVPLWEEAQARGFQILPYSNIPNTTNIYVFILFTGVEGRSPKFQEPLDLRSNPFQGGRDDAILPPKGIDRRLQEDWVKDVGKGPRVLMSHRVDFGPIG